MPEPYPESPASAPIAQPAQSSHLTAYDRGMAVRREVLGDEVVDRAIDGTDDFTAAFQDLVTRYAWGELWTRPGIDRRTRSMLTLAILGTLRSGDELGMHVRAAIRNGVTPTEIQEVLLHVAVYAGFPAANAAFKTAQRLLRTDGVEGEGGAAAGG